MLNNLFDSNCSSNLFINQSCDWLMTPNLAWNYLFEKTNLIKKHTNDYRRLRRGKKKKKGLVNLEESKLFASLQYLLNGI